MECQKYRKQTSIFNSFAFASTFKIFAITETWLSDHIFDREILPANFIVYRKDRTSRGGGVMLAIDLSIPSKIISSPNEIEVIVVQIFTNNPITLCLVYNPPNSTTAYQQNLLNFLTTIMLSNDNVIILGDLTCQILDSHP